MLSGGMKYLEADRLLKVAGPANLMRYYQIAEAVLVLTLMPAVFEDMGIKKVGINENLNFFSLGIDKSRELWIVRKHVFRD